MKLFFFAGSLWKEVKEFSVLCPALDVASQGKTSAEDSRNSLPADAFETFKFKVDVAIKAYA